MGERLIPAINGPAYRTFWFKLPPSSLRRHRRDRHASALNEESTGKTGNETGTRQTKRNVFSPATGSSQSPGGTPMGRRKRPRSFPVSLRIFAATIAGRLLHPSRFRGRFVCTYIASSAAVSIPFENFWSNLSVCRGILQ